MKGTHKHMKELKCFNNHRCLSRSEEINVYEHMVKIVPCESFGKVSPKQVQDRKGRGVEGLEGKLNGNHQRLISGPLDTSTLLALFQNSHVAPSLLCVHIYFLSSDRERHCDRQNISTELPCVCMCLSPGDLFIFSVRVSSFFSYFKSVIDLELPQ